MPFELKVVGSAAASAVVQIRSQVTGQLVSVHHTEGQDVAREALLFEIDSHPFQENLKQAEANLARDRAQLRQAEANLLRNVAELRNAETNEVRYADLARQGIVSREQQEQMHTAADIARESVRASQTAIERARTAMESDLAAIDKAQLELSYCRITSPLAGRSGIFLVHPGNLVSANSGSRLVVINQIPPFL